MVGNMRKTKQKRDSTRDWIYGGQETYRKCLSEGKCEGKHICIDFFLFFLLFYIFIYMVFAEYIYICLYIYMEFKDLHEIIRNVYDRIQCIHIK